MKRSSVAGHLPRPHRALVAALAMTVLWQAASNGEPSPPMATPVEGIEIHADCVGAGAGGVINRCWYFVKNPTGVPKCYRLVVTTLRVVDTGWHPFVEGDGKIPVGEQGVVSGMNCTGSWPDNYCEPAPLSDIYVRVMPYPATGSCAAYRGVADIDPGSHEWYCDVEKAAALAQQPAADIERTCLEQGMKPLRPLTAATTEPAAAPSRSQGGGVSGSPATTSGIDVAALAKGWGGAEWGITLADFKARFPKASVENDWWDSGEGIEKFAGKWMTTRYAFNKHDRLSMVRFLPSEEQRAAVGESVAASLGAPTSESPPHRTWLLPDGDVQVSVMFSGALVLIRHRPLAED